MSIHRRSISRRDSIAAACLMLGAASAQGSPTGNDERLKQLLERVRARPPAPDSAQEREAQAQRRAELVQLGETALARTDTSAALQAFEQAAAIAHMADSEMGLVRTYMQGGEYRRALAFVAHTASAHREVPGGAALYAWLLYIGDQRAHARKLLDDAQSRFPGDQVLALTSGQMRSASPLATGPLLQAPARLAPYSAPLIGLPGAARVACSGVLIDNRRHALVPLAPLKGSTSVWLRDGLGHVARGSLERRLIALQLAVVRLERPIASTSAPDRPPDEPPDSGLAPAGNDPFPGSIGFAVEYVASTRTAPGWPLLASGFIGAALNDGKQRQLGIELPPGPRGGPVFDSAGRLIGIAMAGGAGPAGSRAADQLLLASLLRAAIGDIMGAPAPATGERMSADRIYERAMRSTVQAIVAG